MGRLKRSLSDKPKAPKAVKGKLPTKDSYYPKQLKVVDLEALERILGTAKYEEAVGWLECAGSHYTTRSVSEYITKLEEGYNG